MFPSCMSLLPRRSEPRPPRPGQAPVLLNVYDMYWTNWYTAGAGVGVFHSGVQVHGSEWAYGGHPYAFTGVFEIAPRDERELGEQFRFRQSVHIGYTDFSEEEVRRLVTELGKQFRGDRYHLMNNNCNHFTSAFCLALCERDIPAWVNRLAYRVADAGGAAALAGGTLSLIFTKHTTIAPSRARRRHRECCV
ncbi:PPPDE peptidase domain-containing protein 1 [Papilio machaon]|uniref:PPPDE peptidase domain-containing protein 1 n=1 Tax=Papilio machaon TaxID=76193 RepID=A0A194RII3_PAPMA|nr:PPPDE peptidase domain-containing protein 1 [Papilio machaon]